MAGKGARSTPDVQPKERLDKWLFQARFFKSRRLAAEVVATGHCRVNGQRLSKPGHTIAPGDVLTFPQANRIRLIKVLELGERRGPATEAQGLYTDLDVGPNVTSSPLE